MQISALVTQSVFLVGLAVGTVEEAVFRGVIMKALEMFANKKHSATFGCKVFSVQYQFIASPS